jgi:hypothetical protein
MYKKIKELADKAELPFQAEYGDHYQRLAELVIEECLDVLKTEHSVKHCAYTTFQLGIVECTVDKVEQAIKNRFKD